MKPPAQFARFRRKKDWQGTGVDVIWGIPASGATQIQAFRFPTETFTAAEARAWLRNRKFKPIAFEPAGRTKESQDMADTTNTDAVEARIQEDAAWGPNPKIDEEAGVVRNVAILSKVSRDGLGKVRRTYTDQAMNSGVRVFEGAQVYANHSLESGRSRDVRDLLGHLSNVNRSDGYDRGDFHVLEHHRPMVFSLARQPESKAGLSWDGFGPARMELDGTEIVEDIRVVKSVDLVSKGATVQNLFESQEAGEPRAADDGGDAVSDTNKGVEQLLTKLQEDMADATIRLTEQAGEIKKLSEERDEAKAELAKTGRKAAISAALAEAKLDLKEVPEDLVVLMEACEDDARIKNIIVGMAALRAAGAPVAGDPGHSPLQEAQGGLTKEMVAASMKR